MPLGLPAAGIVRTPDNFEAPIKAFVDNLETVTAAAVTTANAASTLAGQKYTKPGAGIPESDLTTAVQDKINGRTPGLRYEYLWNGSAYVDPLGGAIPTRPSGTLRGFVGPANPNALGLMIDGDRWEDTSA